MKFRKYFGWLGILIFLNMVGFSVHAQSETGRWSLPRAIGPGWFPSIAVDQTNTVHMVWHSGNETLADFLMYTKLAPGGEFEKPLDVVFPAIGGLTVRSALDIDSKGILYTMIRAGTAHQIFSAPASAAGTAANWHRVVDFQNSSYYLSMLVDRNDVIHAVSSEHAVNFAVVDTGNLAIEALRERFPCLFCADVIYRRSEDNGLLWSQPLNLSGTLEGADQVEIQEAQSGRLYISWDEGHDMYVNAGVVQDARFVFSDDDGHTWSDPEILLGNGLYPLRQLALTELRDGRIMVVWRYHNDRDRNIYFQLSDDDGETWTDPEPLPYIYADTAPVSVLDRYELITDLTGAVHFFGVGYDEETQQGPALYHLEYRQDSWLLPNRIYYDPKVRRPEWPAAAVGPQNDLHLGWFVRKGDGKDAGDVGTITVYYASRSATLPDRPVLVAYAPTLTPVPPPTEIPSFAPTPTIIPTLAAINTDVNINRNQDLYAIETVLGALFAVSIMCVGFLVISGFRFRR